MDVDGGGGGSEIMQQGVGSIRGHYIIHSGKSISGEYSGKRCEHQPHSGDLSYSMID